ncbi:MAG: energy-coupling factor ABC transporter ATP-binding protein [Muribaculaceae bacterium]|nr:energy-coupling factor ABC transporter ATP-binding protein [Muribaculaceae bacterium]
MSHHFIRFTGVHYSYPDGTEALKGVSFTATHGERVAILGLNGSGKSTLLLQTNGLLLPTTGEVNVGDVPVTKKTASLVRQAVGMVFQDPDDMLFMPTVYDDVAFGPRNMNLPEVEVERRVTAALKAVGLEEVSRKAAFQLSGGQRRSVAIASVLSMKPDILVLDEPSANLDLSARDNLIKLLDTFHHTILLATHDLEMAKQLCPRAILLNQGRIIADDSTEKVIEIFLSVCLRKEQ